MCMHATFNGETASDRRLRRWAEASPGKPAKFYRISRRKRRASRRRENHFYDMCGQMLTSDAVKAAKRHG